MTNDSLLMAESIVEFSPWSFLQYVWPALSDNWSCKPIFGIIESFFCILLAKICVKGEVGAVKPV